MRLLLFPILLWFIYLVSFFPSGINAQENNPYKILQFDKVIFYDFKGEGNKSLIIIDTKGNYQQKIIGQVILDKQTLISFNNKLGERKSYGAVTASCFDPHCGLVYFLKDKIVAQITICVECNRLYSTIDIPAKMQGKVGKGSDAYYLGDGLSKSFRKYLNQLLKKYNFSNQIKPGSFFDE